MGGDMHKIFYGLGAGRVNNPTAEPDLEEALYSPASDVFLSYGLVTLVLFMLFSTYFLFGSGAPFVVMWIVAIEYHFLSGSFQLPPVLNYCFILSAGWLLKPQKRPAGAVSPSVAPAEHHVMLSA